MQMFVSNARVQRVSACDCNADRIETGLRTAGRCQICTVTHHLSHCSWIYAEFSCLNFTAGPLLQSSLLL